MKIAFANDHAAVPMRHELVQHLQDQGHEIVDCGTATEDSVDYPDTARKALEAVKSGEAESAVLVCGTGLGMSYVGNKFPGIRCALCYDEFSAQMAREHNDAQVIALRARRTDAETNNKILDAFFSTPFSGNARHQRRIDKIMQVEKEYREEC